MSSAKGRLFSLGLNELIVTELCISFISPPIISQIEIKIQNII